MAFDFCKKKRLKKKEIVLKCPNCGEQMCLFKGEESLEIVDNPELVEKIFDNVFIWYCPKCGTGFKSLTKSIKEDEKEDCQSRK